MENRKTVLVANQFEGIERSGELLVDNIFTDIEVYSMLKSEFLG